MDWFPLGLTGLISLQSKGLSRVFFNTTVQKHQFFGAHPSSWSYSYIHIWLLKKTIALTRWTFVGQVVPLLFNKLSRFVLAFLPRSKHLLIPWLQSPSPVILEINKIKSITASIISPSICHEVMGLDAMIFVLWMLSFKPTFSLPLSPSLGGSLVSLHFLSLGWYHLHIWDYWYFSQQSWFQFVFHPAQHFSWCGWSCVIKICKA